MAASLIVELGKAVQFSELLEATSVALSQLLRMDAEWTLTYDLPPTKRHLSLEGRAVDAGFPGAYVRLHGIAKSLVNCHAFSSPVPGNEGRLLFACEASGRGAASEVLAAALAAAAGSLVGGTIDDGGHHWIEKDNYRAEELVTCLQLAQKPASFPEAIEAVYEKQAIHKRYPIRPSDA